MARAGVKRRYNDRLLTNWLSPLSPRRINIYVCIRRPVHVGRRTRGHRRYCLHRSNLLMARPTRWIWDRVVAWSASRSRGIDRSRGSNDRTSITIGTRLYSFSSTSYRTPRVIESTFSQQIFTIERSNVPLSFDAIDIWRTTHRGLRRFRTVLSVVWISSRKYVREKKKKEEKKRKTIIRTADNPVSQQVIFSEN